ncbi:MAG: enoyl-CoA hydratase/isomerase family protein [Thermoplasmata archaeon]|nr:enoyl-CoA hydratase/isomerase family protein [Thermoplasmata archaeon]
MSYETIAVTKEEKTITIALDRPEVHNAMNEKMMKELTSCFKKINSDEQIRVVVLTGNGKSFCAGADLNWMKSMADYTMEENISDSRLLLDLYETIDNCSKPVIGRINGHAFGGGLGLLAVCDINVATPNLKFAFSEVKLGIIPAVISPYVIRRIGIANTRRLFITGERFDSQYAEHMGLIDHVVPQDLLDETIKKYVNLTLTSGPNAVKEVKNLVRMYQELKTGEYKEYTVKKIAELRVSKEGQEGIRAFLEKKKPSWRE